tara:strand:- start:2889 stop:5096 length:2208 start_codon:yes stop_codon:yes gene_type:complete
MRRLQLYIGTERVDLFKDETVSLTQTIKNVKDLAKVFTEFTQTFSVPASSVNNKIFQHYYNFDISNGFDARKKADARIELNDLPFKDGKIALQGVELKNNVAHTYKITFFGNTVNLKDILGDAQLSSLAFNGLNKSYKFTEIRDALSPFTIFPSDKIIAPFITHTNRLIYDSSSHTIYDPEATTNNLYHQGSGSHQQNGVAWNQFKYAIRVSQIITEIQFRYPDIQFSDDFFNDPDNEKFYDLFMWLHRKSGDVQPATQVEVIYTKLEDLVSTNTQVVSSVDGGVIAVSSPPPESVNTPTPGWIRRIARSIRIQLRPNDQNVNYGYQVIRNGGDIILQVNGASGDRDFTITTANDMFRDNSSYFIQFTSPLGIEFDAGDIQIDVNYIIFSPDASLPTYGVDTYENSSTVTIVANPDFQFVIAEQIPKMKIIDFLSGLFNMFNLTAYVNDVGTIVVRTLDSYYSDSTQVYNIDKYLDTTKSTADIALPFKEINFSYKGLGTFLAKQFNQLTNSGWGSLSYSLDGEIFDATSEAYKIELPFEHMMYERLYDANTTLTSTTPTAIQYGYSVNENQQSYKGEPLLFYPIVVSAISTPGGQTPRIRDTQGTGVADLDQFIIPSNSLGTLPSISGKINIHFQNELNEYLANEPIGGGLAPVSPASQFTDTLFETEYKEYIQDVFNFRRRLIKVTAYLPMKVYYNLKLNDLIEIGQDRYKINSMKTDLTSGKTEFELLNTIL